MKNDLKHQNQGIRKKNTCFFLLFNNVVFFFVNSFEEEQQELQKSLSKDWCDKMDNEEAEEKKLHR